LKLLLFIRVLCGDFVSKCSDTGGNRHPGPEGVGISHVSQSLKPWFVVVSHRVASGPVTASPTRCRAGAKTRKWREVRDMPMF